jgi:hypothetical protein
MGYIANLAEWLFGCSHQKTTLPRSESSGAVTNLKSAPSETYVVCLECGRRIPYDWCTMRVRSPWSWPNSARCAEKKELR